jgi:hypothetical protein
MEKRDHTTSVVIGHQELSEEPEESVRITKIGTPVRAFRNEYSEGGVQTFRKIQYLSEV